MDQGSLSAIEYDKIKQKIIQRCATPYGREKAVLAAPVSSLGEAKELMRQAAEAMEYLAESGTPFLRSFGDVLPLVNDIMRKRVLTPSEMRQVATAIDTMYYLRNHLTSDAYPYLAKLASKLWDFHEWVLEVEGKISPKGEVLDDASPRLKSIRERIKKHSRAIKEKVESLRRRYHRFLAGGIPYKMLEGRYVLAVQRSYFSQVKGILHGFSDTGKTAYVEPTELVQMNNEMENLLAQEEEEIKRIMANLGSRLRDLIEESGKAPAKVFSVLGDIDYAFARASWGISVRGAAPSFTREKYLRIVLARHPLIPDDKVVPLERLELGGDGPTLMLITGPNTGGKTVTLKTVGLMVALALTGIPIPADPDTVIPVVDGIYADIGDEQSIEQSLSTFSSHMLRILEILSNATEHSLVLIDELGAGTDPTEGVALGKVIIEELLKKGALTLITTHHGELSEFVDSLDATVNASMEFDVRTLEPKYRLVVGVPGRSYALEISRRLGMPEELVERARSYLPGTRIERDKLIEKLEREKAEVEALKAELEEKKQKIEELKRELEEREKKLEERETRLKTRILEEYGRQLQEVEKKSKELLTTLEKKSKADAEAYRIRHEIKKTVKEIQQEKAKQREKLRRPRVLPHKVVNRPPRPGDNVLVSFFGKLRPGIVVEVRGDMAKVIVKNMTMTIGVDNLQVIEVDPEEFLKEEKGVSVDYQVEQVPMKLDLHGKRVEEALELLERYLDRAVAAGYHFVYVVHGRGTGALKSAIHMMLSKDPRVASFRPASPDEGGDGITIVYLAGG